jgi:hypothetical protein
MKLSNLKLIVLAGVLAAGSAFADNRAQLNGILSLPLGDFKDSGFATTGFGADLEYSVPIQSGPIEWVSGASFFMHFLDGDGLKKAAGIPSGANVTVSGGTFIDVPLLTGLRIAAPAGPTTKIYGQFQLGLNLFYETETKLTDGTTTITVTPDPLIRLGLGFGAGIIFNDRFNVGLRFFKMPEADASGKADFNGTEGDLKGKVSLTALQIMAGVAF